MFAPALVGVPGAQAHDYLVGSTPDQGSTVTTPPSEVVLEFNTSVGQQFAQVAVVGRDGSTYQSGDPVVDGSTVTQAVEGLPDAGAVTISYRVVSSDGHPIGGTVPFTIAGSTDATADGQATPTPDTGALGSPDDEVITPVVWVAAGIVAFALAAGAVVLSRGRSRNSVDA